MTAAEVKDALRRRHPAIAGPGWDVGPWTCLEEFENVDLLALAAWTQPRPARVRHARIGYEVKVSRADYKRELRKPAKRATAVALCHEFYFAVPGGLLSPDELEWAPPPGLDARDAFARDRCPGAYGAFCSDGLLVYMGTVDRRAPAFRRETERWGRSRWRGVDYRRAYSPTCPTCRGAGWVAESPAVRAGAPKIWVPADVGLLEVSQAGTCRVVRQAPLRRDPEALTDGQVALLARWASVRPDPRHAREPAPL